MSFSGRLKDLMKKYGKVAIGVHLTVSFTSIGGLYVAIKNNVDVESIFQKVGISPADQIPDADADADADAGAGAPDAPDPRRNRTAELAATSGGALALAILCNKALFPLRVPVTIALTPPIAKFLARRNLIKSA